MRTGDAILRMIDAAAFGDGDDALVVVDELPTEFTILLVGERVEILVRQPERVVFATLRAEHEVTVAGELLLSVADEAATAVLR